MKILFSALLSLTFSLSALANGTCSGMAKNAAIRAYKAEVGTVQGSEGIQYEAKLVGERGPNFNYLVTISDNNEDGETWRVTYSVVVQAAGSVCRILSTKKL